MNKRTHLGQLILSVACLFNTTTVFAEDIKCWTNEDGIMECGNVIPQQYVKEKHEIRNDSGDVVEVIQRDKTEAEIKALIEAEQQRFEQEKKDKRQAEEDRRLLDLYPTENDIILARDSQLMRIEQGIRITKGQLKSYQNTLKNQRKLEKQLATRSDASSKTDRERLAKHSKNLEAQIKVIENSIKDKEQDTKNITAEYDVYLQRYKAVKKRQISKEKGRSYSR
ncbi:hypothetical protein QUF61_06120 [Candidatus Venteria ishoeyi]|uniref:hypothetical protein n=1 Tax=Candidatus Venteria ishoeyi TaxID=1899563 RepID=UPI0025A4F8EC|nr:hypothetical protein [Candidatus Venteria ishoeyi]MDM8546051.1 hypothetical protein [Candidatus Venteria ishoeyi]